MTQQSAVSGDGSSARAGAAHQVRRLARCSAIAGALFLLPIGMVWLDVFMDDRGMPVTGSLHLVSQFLARSWLPSLLGASAVFLGYGVISLIWGLLRPVQHGHRVWAIAGILCGCVSMWAYGETQPLLTNLHMRQIDWYDVSAIHEALRIHAQGHSGSYPPDMQALITANLIAPFYVRCPAHRDTYQTCRTYVPGQRADDDPQNVLVYGEGGSPFGSGAHVLFVDGRIEWVAPYSCVLELVGQTKQRLVAKAAQSAPAPVPGAASQSAP